MLRPLMLAPLLVFGAFAALALVGLSRENPNELPDKVVEL